MNNFVFILIFISIIISILIRKNINILVLIIILILLYQLYLNSNKDTDRKNETDIINEGNATNNYRIRNLKEKLKYLENDKELIDIIENINFVKKYDNPRYIELKNIMNKFKKTYVYIMSDRWELNHFITTLKELRNDILENMYSMFLIIPKKQKNVFGFDTFNELNKSIDKFIKYSDEKFSILNKYGYIVKQMPYVNETNMFSYNERDIHMLP